MLKDVGESVEEKAQEEIKNEKKKTGIQVCFIIINSVQFSLLHFKGYFAAVPRAFTYDLGLDSSLFVMGQNPNIQKFFI